jgi:membrane fusion protein, heavy metal efflux system
MTGQRSILNRICAFGCLGILVGVTGCSSAKSANAPAPSPPDHAPVAGAVALEPKMLSSIQVADVSEMTLPSILMASGKVQFNEDRMANVSPPAPGQVQELRVKVGDHIQKGDLLFYVYSRDAASAIAEHLESHKDLDLAEKVQLRTRDLFEHEAASRVSLEQAESEVAKAKTRVARTEDSLRALGVTVDDSQLHASLSPKIPLRAPISGTLMERHLTDGQFVQPDPMPSMVIADLSTVWVMADVFERDLSRVHVGQRAHVTAAAYPDAVFTATISRIGDVVDPMTRTVKVRFLVANDGQRLKPEMFVSSSIVLNEQEKGISVPRKAVITEGGASYVYVEAGEGAFVRRAVEMGEVSDGRARIVSGLKPGEKIVSDGALLIRAEERNAGN